MIKGLEKLFQEIIKKEEIPKEATKVKVSLMHKGGRKDKLEIKNYRPIAVANSILNILCGIIKSKLSKIIETKEILSEEQNGFRKDRRGTDNIYSIKAIQEKYRKENKELYCAFLDIEKAYDTVDRNILYEILKRIGLGKKTINIIKSLYRNTQMNFNWKGIEIENVKSDRGLRQGCTLSPLLFALYIEELTRRIKNTKGGIDINKDKLKILLFADDIILLAENKEELQNLLNEIHKYSTETNMKFSPEKSKYMIINEKETDKTNEEITLGQIPMEKVKEYKYLGLLIGSNNLDKEKNNLRAKAEANFQQIKTKMHMRVNTYEITRTLWKGVAVPNILYGTEILDLGRKENQHLETVQNKMARLGLKANKYAGTETLRGEMGWSSFEERVDKAKIKYKWRLENMNDKRWAKKIYNWTENKGKTQNDYNKKLRKYDIKILGTRERKKVLIENKEITKQNKINKEIDKRVKERGLKEWKKGMEKKKSLLYYANKERPNWEPIYNGTWESSLLFKARSNSLEVKERENRWKNTDERCNNCNIDTKEDLRHLLIECPKYEKEREKLERKIKMKIGEHAWEQEKRKMDNGVKFILGLEKEKISTLMLETKEYLKEIWLKRKKSQEKIIMEENDHNYV